MATALWTDAELEAGVTLDGVVTVRLPAPPLCLLHCYITLLSGAVRHWRIMRHALQHTCLCLQLRRHDISMMLSLLPNLALQVADARNLQRQLAAVPANASGGSANEAQQQIAYSDVVLINKVRFLCRRGFYAGEAALLGRCCCYTVWMGLDSCRDTCTRFGA